MTKGAEKLYNYRDITVNLAVKMLEEWRDKVKWVINQVGILKWEENEGRGFDSN